MHKGFKENKVLNIGVPRKEKKLVTICIGVICDNRTKAIAVSDRMLTSADQSLAFEHDEPKITVLFDNCLAVTAGPATIHQPIFQAVRSEVREPKPSISDVAQKIKSKYQESRRSLLNDYVFSRRGLTIDLFHENQRVFHESTILELNERMDEFDLGLDIGVVGVDQDLKAHIYSISNPGMAIPHNPLGFCCIGSGLNHANTTFAYRRFTPSFPLKRAIYVAFEAKKRAEMAGGVGPTTDIAIVSRGIAKNKDYKLLSPNAIKQLEDIYKEMENKSQYGKEIDDAVETLSI